MEFHGNKWINGITALPQFPYFWNLSDFNLKWESVIKSTAYFQKAILSIATGFFSCSLICNKYDMKKKQNITLYI